MTARVRSHQVKAQLAMGVYGARQLCEQLQAIRVNTSATAPATEDRMIAIESLEQVHANARSDLPSPRPSERVRSCSGTSC